MFSLKDRKQKRSLESIWKISLLNPNHYFIPKSIDDFKTVGLFDSKLTVNSIEWYFIESTKSKFKDFLKVIYSIGDINTTVSVDTVYSSIKIELETEIQLKEQQKDLRNFDDVLYAIFNRISQARKEYEFYFPIEGIELNNINSIELNSVQVIVFEVYLKNIMLSSTNVTNSTKENVEKFINENLLAHLCIKCSFFGDYKKAQEEAKFRARETLNYFRYLICILKFERIYEELIKIRFLSEAYMERDEFLAKNQEDDSLILVWGRGRSNFENFVIDEVRFQELKERGFLNEFAEIINSPQNTRTQLQGCILSAIYWAGEAQNEYDWDICFLKFWTAIEGIFSYNKDEKIRQTLARGVSILLALGGLIEVRDIKETRQEVLALYDERCCIVHGGVRRRIKSSQLVAICKYTAWTILCLLNLRSIGYKTIKEIDEEIRRIDNIISSKNSKEQDMRKLLQTTAQYAVCYLEGLDARNVAPTEEAIANLIQFDEPFPNEPVNPELVLQLLDRVGSPASMAQAGSRFFGLVTGGSLPAALAANWLAAAWDQNCGLYRITPATALLEQVALRWLLEVLHLPADCGGAFVTGATVANFTALAAARHAVLEREGWNVEADGLFGAPPITVAVSEEAHPSLLKALGLLGLGRSRVVKVPVDGQGRMRPDAIPTLTRPAIICTQVGNVNTGACDPVGEICDRAKTVGAWVHVDGAFGLWAAAALSLAHLTAGMEEADSWATDAHKWLNVPYDSGLAFVRDANALQAAMAITAEYLPTVSEQRNPSDFTPELSRRARGVEVWAALRSLGRSGLADLIERTCRHARHFAKELKAAGYPILNDVVLNQVLVSFGDAETTHRVIADIQAEGTCWCGSTVWQGQTAMRISVSSWATTDVDVEKSLAAMLRIAGKYCSGEF